MILGNIFNYKFFEKFLEKIFSLFRDNFCKKILIIEENLIMIFIGGLFGKIKFVIYIWEILMLFVRGF